MVVTPHLVFAKPIVGISVKAEMDVVVKSGGKKNSTSMQYRLD
jgi:hypothetical protein